MQELRRSIAEPVSPNGFFFFRGQIPVASVPFGESPTQSVKKSNKCEELAPDRLLLAILLLFLEMIRDRLREFQEKSGQSVSSNWDQPGTSESLPSGASGSKIEKKPLLSSQKDPVEQFLVCVDALHDNLQLLETYAADVNEKHSQILIQPHQEQKSKDELDQANAAFKALSESLRISLKKAEFETDAIRNERKAKGNYDKDAIDLRIRSTHVGALTRQVMDIISRFSADQAQFREKCEKRIHDYLNLTGTKMNQSEIDEMVATGNIYSTASGILHDTQRAREVLREVEQRFDDIKHAEKMIIELQQLFIDLAHLVELQGEHVDSIEQHVMNSVDVTERAKTQMHGAEQAARRYRKRKLILVIVILVVLIIIGAVIAISICSEEKSKCFS